MKAICSADCLARRLFPLADNIKGIFALPMKYIFSKTVSITLRPWVDEKWSIYSENIKPTTLWISIKREKKKRFDRLHGDQDHRLSAKSPIAPLLLPPLTDSVLLCTSPRAVAKMPQIAALNQNQDSTLLPFQENDFIIPHEHPSSHGVGQLLCPLLGDPVPNLGGYSLISRWFSLPSSQES